MGENPDISRVFQAIADILSNRENVQVTVIEIVKKEEKKSETTA